MVMEHLPSVAQMRPVTQPPTVLGRPAEHWTGTLYLRRVSPYVTRLLLATRITPNGVTWLMIISGAAAGVALLLPGWPGAVLAVLCAQLQMLLDCPTASSPGGVGAPPPPGCSSTSWATTPPRR